MDLVVFRWVVSMSGRKKGNFWVSVEVYALRSFILVRISQRGLLASQATQTAVSWVKVLVRLIHLSALKRGLGRCLYYIT